MKKSEKKLAEDFLTQCAGLEKASILKAIDKISVKYNVKPVLKDML